MPFRLRPDIAKSPGDEAGKHAFATELYNATEFLPWVPDLPRIRNSLRIHQKKYDFPELLREQLFCKLYPCKH